MFEIASFILIAVHRNVFSQVNWMLYCLFFLGKESVVTVFYEGFFFFFFKSQNPRQTSQSVPCVPCTEVVNGGSYYTEERRLDLLPWDLCLTCV